MTDTEKLKRYRVSYKHGVISDDGSHYSSDTSMPLYLAHEADALIASLRSALLAAREEIVKLSALTTDTMYVPFDDYSKLLASAAAQSARIAALEPNARRYEWLKTRINWDERFRQSGNVGYSCREWTHIDLRSVRPDSEHIDEYIDSMLAALESGEGK